LSSENRNSTTTHARTYDFDVVPANNFTYPELTDTYNRSRVDYIIPMPMSVNKMREYVQVYDVDLQLSVVAVEDDTTLGLGMLGKRGSNTWITRLGVVPNGRKRGVGGAIMHYLVERSREINAKQIILEVIKNNEPAEVLFKKYGFEIIRELLVIKRPPQPINVITHGIYIDVLSHQEALDLLCTRRDMPSWVSANDSMFNAGELSALWADFDDGSQGWLVYQDTVLQLARLVIQTIEGDFNRVATGLLQHLHWRHAVQGTISENLPISDRHWPTFQDMGYSIAFSRIEMLLNL